MGNGMEYRNPKFDRIKLCNDKVEMEPPKKLQKVTALKNDTYSWNVKELKQLPDVEATELLEKDLPLLSNTDEVTVLHYLIKLNFQMQEEIVLGNLIIFLEPIMQMPSSCEGHAEHSNCLYTDEIVLDCCTLDVSQVFALEFCDNQIPATQNPNRFLENSPNNCADWFKAKPLGELKFKLTKWSLRIHSWPCASFPSVIQIEYKTSPKTPSLYWRSTEVGTFCYGTDPRKQCVYTAASPVNNRGLFPCQEPPIAMATWESFLTVPKGMLALVTSDKPCTVFEENVTCTTFYASSNHKLPMSTFAIVVGHFSIQMLDFIPHNSGVIPTRLFSLCPDLKIPEVIELPVFVQKVLISSKEILGPNLFARLDIIIMPRRFHIMGLANPHMMFLSPCLYSGNEKNGLMIYSRIAHEIAHSWFGLAIGALDWAEEWLSEGFATFVEDILYRKAMIECGIKSEVLDVEIDLRIGLRLHTLQQELSNNLDATDLKVIASEESSKPHSCKNGLNPMKQFNHVHYIKGYFFLRYLSSLVGSVDFLAFLKTYVENFSGKLVTSNDFVTFYCETFKTRLDDSNTKCSLESLQNIWFYNVKLPEPLNSINVLNFSSHPAAKTYFEHHAGFENVQKIYDELFIQNTSEASIRLTSNELILLFEKLIADADDTTTTNFSSLSPNKLKTFLNFKPEEYNPDVGHRWCEIILKFYFSDDQNSTADSVDVNVISDFLLRNPAMGIYLYGELMISEQPVLQNVARSLYDLQIETLDFESKQVLKEMIF